MQIEFSRKTLAGAVAISALISVGLVFFGLGLSQASAHDDQDQPAQAQGTPPPPGNQSIEVDPRLAAKFSEANVVQYLIEFDEVADLSPAYALDWEARGRFVVAALQDAAAHTQSRVRRYLETQQVPYQPFWISNVIIIQGSDEAVFEGLLAFQEISALRSLAEIHLIEPEHFQAGRRSPREIESNLTQIQVPSVWTLGVDGGGILVGNIDTGVRYTHEALISRYRGNQGGGVFDHNFTWWDATGDFPLVPGDDHGHGSHTMGIIVGDDGSANQIGVAPGAEWIACRACDLNGSCPHTDLLECAEFVMAPWDLNGQNPNPDLRPQVVNNSWGDCETEYDDWFQQAVNSWLAAGIYPVFSNGNAGNCSYPQPPGLNTVGNPARYGNVTGVGSTGQSDGLYASHSNWGPTDNADILNPLGPGDLKPQVLAPGVGIRSSVETSDSAYDSFTGTSMSAPHVSGVIALMWQVAPCLIGDYETTENILESTATPVDYDDGTGGGAHSPNYAAGWGEIDALGAVEAAQQQCRLFYLLPDSETVNVCQPADAVIDVEVLPVQLGFADPVALSAVRNPGGTSTNFSVNPVTPPGTSILTVQDTGSASPGATAMDIVGVGLTETYTATVELNLFDGPPGAPTLITPADGATEILNQPILRWDASGEIISYQVELAASMAFDPLIYTATVLTNNHRVAMSLDSETTYYWRVWPENACGDGESSAVSVFTTRATPPILLVDDDNNNPDSRPAYTATLASLGLAFDIWDTENSNDEPTTVDLGPYKAVIWFTGSESLSPVTGPGAAGEAAVISWLESGGCMLFSSQDYEYARGLTPFLQDYFGISFINDVFPAYWSVTGQGTTYGGLGPYAMDFQLPFFNFSDQVEPDGTSESAFMGDEGHGAGVSKDTGVFQTTFLGYPLETLSGSAREAVIQAFMSLCANPGVRLSQPAEGLGPPGSHIQYTIHLTNTGDLSDTFGLGAAGLWPVSLSITETGGLMPGETTSFTVGVTVPSEMLYPPAGTTTVTATSNQDTSVSASSILLTIQDLGRTYLPSIGVE